MQRRIYTRVKYTSSSTLPDSAVLRLSILHLARYVHLARHQVARRPLVSVIGEKIMT